MIYFISAPQLNRIKIGHTKSIIGRFGTIRTSSPVPVKLLATMEGGYSREHEIHEQFVSSRRHGEWFEDTPELRAFIAEHAVRWRGATKRVREERREDGGYKYRNNPVVDYRAEQERIGREHAEYLAKVKVALAAKPKKQKKQKQSPQQSFDFSSD